MVPNYGPTINFGLPQQEMNFAAGLPPAEPMFGQPIGYSGRNPQLPQPGSPYFGLAPYTPQQEVELGLRRPGDPGWLGDVLMNPIGYGANKITQGIEALPTGPLFGRYGESSPTIGEQIDKAPAPVRMGANFALGAAPFAAAQPFGGEGGALEEALPLLIQQQIAQGTAETSGQYAAGEISGKQALTSIAVNAAQVLGPHLLRIGIDTIPKAAEWVRSPEGQAAIGDVQTKLAGETGKVRLPGTNKIVPHEDLSGAPSVLEPTGIAYHGTGARFNAFNEGKMDATALYGPGVYLTDDQGIARTYAEKRAAQLTKRGVTAESTVQSVLVKPGLRVLNMERPLPKEAADVYLQAAQHLDAGDYVETAIKSGSAGSHVSEMFREALAEEDRLPAYEAGDILADINEGLQRAGYDGIAHQGGIQGGAKHGVTIIFDPANVTVATPTTRALALVQDVGARLGSERGSLGTPPEPPKEPAETGAAGAGQPPPPSEPSGAQTTPPNQRGTGISKEAAGLEHIVRTPEEVAQDATARGATPELAQALQQTMHAIDLRTSGPDSILTGSPLRQRISATASRITGSIPGQVGKIADQLQNFGYALAQSRGNVIRDAKPVADAIHADIKNLIPTFVGEDASKIAAASSPEAYVFEFPEEFSGVSRELADRIQAVKDAQQSHFALLQAVDPTTAASHESYLTHVYQGENTSPLETRIPHQRGEVQVAQERAYPDWRVAVDNGLTMKKMPLLEQINYGLRKADTGVDDALFRKAVLSKYAVTNAKEAPAGYAAVRNSVFTRPEEGPFYVPKEINNFIDQRYAPPTGPLAETRGISAKLKGLVVFPLDVGGLAQRLREIGTTNPLNVSAGLLHHILTSPEEGSLATRHQFAIDGLPQGNEGSILSESASLPTKVGAKYTEVSRAPWQALNGLRNLAHEGNLAIMDALGMDTSTTTAKGIANRQASAEFVRATSGASKGAQRFGRDALEKSGLLSQQNTRALISQIGVAGNLIRPGASAGQRLLAAQGIASLATGIWGMGSLINMQLGDGKPLQFPVTWDGSKFVYNPNWDMVTIGGYKTPMLPQRTLVTAIAKAFTELGNIRPDQPAKIPGQIGGAAQAVTQFGMGRLGPTTKPVGSALGYGYDPSGRPYFGNMPAGQRFLSALPEPITTSKIAQSGIPRSPGELGGIAAEQGLGTYPPLSDQTQQRMKTAAFKDKLNGQGFQQYVDRRSALVDQHKKLTDQYGANFALSRDPAARRAAQVLQQQYQRLDAEEYRFWSTHRDLLKQALQQKAVTPTRRLLTLAGR